MLNSRCVTPPSSLGGASARGLWRGATTAHKVLLPPSPAAASSVAPQQQQQQQQQQQPFCDQQHSPSRSWHHHHRGFASTSRPVLATHAAPRPGGGSTSSDAAAPPTAMASATATTTATAGVSQQQPPSGPATGLPPQPPQPGQPQQPQQQQQQPAAARHSPLHYNIEEFCQRVVPSEDERKYRTQIVELVRTHTRKAMQEAGRRCDVQVFGSFVTGLSTWSSDVDLVVTGIMEPDRHTGVYDVAERGRVVGRLRRIGEALRRCKKLDNPRISIIPRARIPIIKLKVRNVNVDISISDDMGTRAARHMAQQVRAYPPMRPLVLVLKAYLKSAHLNEVMTGGLSSYSLCNMVVAHLQEELKAGRDIFDYGEALYAFLLRYGEEFDYGHDAISIESGGIVPKHVLGIANDYYPSGGGGGGPGLDRYFDRLAVDCPITGRDVSNGTYRIDAVRAAFQRGARRLEALARGRRVDDLSVNYLQALFDVQRVLKRSAGDEDGLGGYGAAFEQVFGRGTSPEIIQLDNPRNNRDLDLDEEELLGDDGGASTSTSSFDDLTGDEDGTRWDGGPVGNPQQQQRGGRHKGGPRGKGPRTY